MNIIVIVPVLQFGFYLQTDTKYKREKNRHIKWTRLGTRFLQCASSCLTCLDWLLLWISSQHKAIYSLFVSIHKRTRIVGLKILVIFLVTVVVEWNLSLLLCVLFSETFFLYFSDRAYCDVVHHYFRQRNAHTHRNAFQMLQILPSDWTFWYNWWESHHYMRFNNYYLFIIVIFASNSSIAHVIIHQFSPFIPCLLFGIVHVSCSLMIIMQANCNNILKCN